MNSIVRCFYCLLIASIFCPNLALGLDANNNGLSDVWEQRFGASALLPENDEDEDGFTNGEESAGGTNPFDKSDKPELLNSVSTMAPDTLSLSFITVSGKRYYLNTSKDLQVFKNLYPVGWMGSNTTREIILSQGSTTTQSPVRCEFWADITGGTIESLTGLTTFPQEPDGTAFHNEPTAPKFLATDYGCRITTRIQVPQTGDYVFYLSSGGPAELYLSTLPSGANPTKIAYVLPGQNDIEPLEWDTYESQYSAPIALEAGKSYFIELCYVSTVASQHAQIGWSGPGLNDVELMGSNALADQDILGPYQPPVVLFEHDYETIGQTNILWPNNTTLDSAPRGMRQNVERMTGDPGTTSEETVPFTAATTDHLYATWLFNMSTGHDDANLVFLNGTISSQEGPRINMEERSSGTIATVRAGGPFGTDVQFNVTFDETYRIEIVASLSSDGFTYGTPGGMVTVNQDRFDIYVSDANGNLVGNALDLPFRDAGTGVVQQFSSLRAIAVTNPDIAFDGWEISSGRILGNGFLLPNQFDFGQDDWMNFFKLTVEDMDQDADGLSDGDEISLANHQSLLFFDDETTNGTNDSDALAPILAAATGTPSLTLLATDTDAFESNYPNTIPDDAEITLIRTGNLAPLTVEICLLPMSESDNVAMMCSGSCCSLVGDPGDEPAEPEDFEILDADGNVITDTVEFAFGETTKVLKLRAINDGINEYPETVVLSVKEATDGSYTIAPGPNGGSIVLYDLPDNPENLTIFTGNFTQDGNAVIMSNGSGFLTATINGPRTEMRFWNEFSNLTSAQQDSHVHKSGAGSTPGNIVYAITNEPGNESGDPPGSDPFNGFLVNYPWDLTESSGAVSTGGGSASKQVLIDSLFGQNGESPLYLNIHTVDNPAGEIWAFLKVSGGSITDPGDAAPGAAPGSAAYPLLTGNELEAEVRRFLNQATFGATDTSVAQLLTQIETERLSDPNYHRHNAFSDWIDGQMNPTTTAQTYLLEYTLASSWQFMTLAGLFDPAINPTDGTTPTPTPPATWPYINRSASDPSHIYLESVYPMTRDEDLLGNSNGINAEPSREQRRNANWQMMLNAKDQLRQKMGFALQQIVVVSETSNIIRNNPYGSANYSDLLNTYAFEYYRDVLGFVNLSPIMGKWLSSLQNQKAIDFDGDGVFDTYPDENLARENMQLFSIGLFEVWSDGTLKLNAAGLPRPSYTNDDIREFAKVLTGQNFSRYNEFNTPWGGVPYTPDNTNFNTNSSPQTVFREAFLYPMKMFGDFHSLGPKTFAGTTIDNSSITDPTLQGEADIEDAMDWLAGKPGDGLPDFDMVNSHVSTPAFICQRLIQRFTTSNPSQDYLHRVATVFKNSEGHLGMTVKAILLDPEARQFDLNNITFGLKKSPMEGYIQLVRALDGHSYLPLFDPQGAFPYDTAPGDFSNPEIYLGGFDYPADQLANHERNARFNIRSTFTTSNRGLQMDPFAQETVFNYYLPDYNPGGAIGNAGLVAPELQLANEPDIIRNINYFEDLIRSTLGPAGDEIGGTNETQEAAFNSVDAEQHDYLRLARQTLADTFYPAVAPTPTPGRTAESLADEALLDELDKRLTNGVYKMRYPYDPSDDDDPSVAGVDDLLKNPRELIIDAITDGYPDPYSGVNDDTDRRNKFADALYLLTYSPEYQIKK